MHYSTTKRKDSCKHDKDIKLILYGYYTILLFDVAEFKGNSVISSF